MKLVWVLVAVSMAAVYWGWKVTSRSGYETPDYRLLESEGRFEIRQYPRLWLASTSSKLSSQGGDGSFMRLFRYISGANERSEKVAMTTPVLMEGGTGPDGKMGFLIPEKTVQKGVPLPSHETVSICERPGGKFAVVRFSGPFDSMQFHEQEASLSRWLRERGYTAVGEAEVAGYDPPWTPGFLRRNEILFRVSERE